MLAGIKAEWSHQSIAFTRQELLARGFHESEITPLGPIIT